MKSSKHWIVTADERQAIVYSAALVAGGRTHIEKQEHLESRWENYHDHHRPDSLGRGPSANAAQRWASTGHESEEECRRFARDVIGWLAKATQDLSIQHLDLFAAPRFLGVLRGQLGHLAEIADLHEAELTRMPASALATHPAVLEAIGSWESLKSARR